jgi:hypothetical protein
MKTLFEIINEVKDGGRPEYEDLRYALIALDALAYFDKRALMGIQGKGNYTVDYVAESFARWKVAFDKPPKEYVGKNNDPDNPAVQRRRRVALKLLDKFTQED